MPAVETLVEIIPKMEPKTAKPIAHTARMARWRRRA